MGPGRDPVGTHMAGPVLRNMIVIHEFVQDPGTVVRQ